MGRLSKRIPQWVKNYLYHLPKSLFAVLLYRYPAKNLTVIGVTGSDGKTTTTHLIYHILHSLGYKVAMISTVVAKIGEDEVDTGFHVTSPDPFLLQKLLRTIADKGFTHVVLEATSHGLDQFRLVGSRVRVAVLTNITHEHIDYHRTYQNYLKAKSTLFVHAKQAILNKDDKSYELLKPLLPRFIKIHSYGLGTQADLRAVNIVVKDEVSKFTLAWGNHKRSVELHLPGRYNVQNALAALSTTLALGISIEQAVPPLATFSSVKGRLNLVHNKPDIYVDFAHTPNALEQVLTLLKSQKKPGSRLIAVFGCAGERDYLKRPMMGKISGRLADISIFTSEDPRSEKVDKIIDQMVSGAKKTKAKELNASSLPVTSPVQSIYIREPDRQKAINIAVKIARVEDVVVVTGKGHEEAMNFGRGETPWSDFEAIKQALKNNE